jgi:aspartate dehydrogenase
MSELLPLRIALIGDGGISRSVRATIAALAESILQVKAVLSRRATGDDVVTVTDLESLLAASPDVVVECASHEAVAAYGETILRRGVPLVIVSAGALADGDLYYRLNMAARAGRTRLIVAPGAVAGIDALAAARLGGVHRVSYRGLKPPTAWLGTPAEKLLDLTAVTTPTVFYRGNAREAARAYPKNSNVAATIAMAGVGFERTEVELVADPTVPHNVHELSFDAVDGRFHTTSIGMPSPSNPKTSMLTAHSVVRILTAMRSPVVFG